MNDPNNPCIFCKIRKEEFQFENQLAYSSKDSFPVSEFHSLIVPKRHVETYFDLTKEEKIALMDEALLRSLNKFDNCNISQVTSSDDGSISIGSEQNTGGGSVASSDMSGTDISMPQENSDKEESVSANTDIQVFKSKEEDGNGSPSRLNPSQANGANGKIPEENSIMSFSMLLNLVETSNAENKELLWKFVKKYKENISEKDHPIFDNLVGYAIKYFNDVIKAKKKYKIPDQIEKKALEALISVSYTHLPSPRDS